ncbi:YDG/SRA domain-containing protein [Streptomyces sp. FIT100]|uniref:YDG/SRA domain-containing protein n=1 Tax=Streptomyces sp. FIT100 TaxID=2837956 RepID=UPI0021C8D3A5|nr:YDG/SRA domain-containing protein [Streptomyces sp. FIT100]UUN27098.1 HNH endonuclease [Streptomyces sp. FIT100]
MAAERTIGHIDGVIPGEVFHRRADVFAAKLHGDMVRGISKYSDKDGRTVGDAIVLNGGYEDDDDRWTRIRYTGASPEAERERATSRVLKDQSWEYEDNAALKLSFERKYSVRIIRGPKGDRRYSLRDDYRYDGLYVITAIRTAVSKTPAPDGSQIKICQFDLERLPDTQQELTEVEQHVAEMLEFDTAEKFPETRTTQVQRLVRDAAAARRIKDLYEGQCQVCRTRLVGGDGRTYSEGAHVRPLGKPHDGPDVERNILCLCPNCHVRLDTGAISIAEDWTVIDRSTDSATVTPRKLWVKKQHGLHPDHLSYHLNWWNRELSGQ